MNTDEFQVGPKYVLSDVGTNRVIPSLSIDPFSDGCEGMRVTSDADTNSAECDNNIPKACVSPMSIAMTAPDLAIVQATTLGDMPSFLKKQIRNVEVRSFPSNIPLRICVLQSKPEGSVYENDDSPADLEVHFNRAGYTRNEIQIENVFLSPQNFAQTIVQLVTKRFNNKHADDIAIDCFLNLCDGAWDEPSVGIEVVDLLENKLKVPFTGSNASFFEPTRLQMKKAALSCVNVKVPNWRFVYSVEDLQKLLSEFDGADNSNINPCKKDYQTKILPLQFPLLVKHFSSYSSVGLTKESKVWDVLSLQSQCLRMLDLFGGCLIEEFIIGREFTVLVSQYVNTHDEIDVIAYEPIECRFGPDEDFKHYNLKWVDFDNMSWHPITAAEKDLCSRLKAMSIAVFQAIGGRGYGRIDVRSDESGTNLYFLEINPNCGIFYPPTLYGSADYILNQYDPVSGHANFALQQIAVAQKLWQRCMEETSIVEARYNSTAESWGLFALRKILVNEIIQKNEEQSVCIVSKSHIVRNWKGIPHDVRSRRLMIDASNEKGTDYGVPDDEEKKDFEAPETNSFIHRGDGLGKIHNTYKNFQSYCWPLSDNLFVMWHPEPDKWYPINHSCDPNSWFEMGNGLNVVARYEIDTGDEITMDYATFCGYFPEMRAFSCCCGSHCCRGEITGMDIIRHPELALQYANHMTDYVASKAVPYQNDDDI